MTLAYMWVGPGAPPGFPAGNVHEEDLAEMAAIKYMTVEELRAHLDAAPAYRTATGEDIQAQPTTEDAVRPAQGEVEASGTARPVTSAVGNTNIPHRRLADRAVATQPAPPPQVPTTLAVDPENRTAKD
jgi:hypothetical protein